MQINPSQDAEMLTETRTLSRPLTQLGARGPHRTSTGDSASWTPPTPTHTLSPSGTSKTGTGLLGPRPQHSLPFL